MDNDTYVDQLSHLRDLLAAAVVDADPRWLPGLARELRQVLKELHRVAPASSKSSPIDEIIAARERRLRRDGDIG